MSKLAEAASLLRNTVWSPDLEQIKTPLGLILLEAIAHENNELPVSYSIRLLAERLTTDELFTGEPYTPVSELLND